VQSTQQAYLDLLGRRHAPDEAFAAIDLIRGEGMPLNIDMMYRLPGETLAQVDADLDAVRSLGIEHISWFNYVAHEGTGLAAKIQRGRVLEPADREGYFVMFEAVGERMADSGYEQYTPYHFAGSARCEYHVDRWAMPQLETLGLGAGAFSFFNGWIYANEHSLARYADATAANRPPVMMGKRLDRRETITRLAVLGSKLFTLDKGVFRDVAGVSMDDFYGDELELLQRLGLVQVTDERVDCTPVGKAFSNDVAAVFGTDAAKRVPQPQGVQLQRASR
jgi:oxygen-independent coproporphyrinogen-3 oxidase